MDRLEWARYYKKECEKKSNEIERLRKALEGIAMGDIETRDEAIEIARQALEER